MLASKFRSLLPRPLYQRLFSNSLYLVSRDFKSSAQDLAPMSPTSFKAIVIGSGQSGTPLVSALAAAGHKTALIESAHVGGTCINVGCTPTKTMVASAKVAYYARRQADFGVTSTAAVEGQTSAVMVDMKTVRKRKRDIVNTFRGGSEGRLEKAENVTLVRGQAKFVGKKEVEVSLKAGGEKERLSAEWIFINVGCRPTPLDIPGANEVAILDSTSIMELDIVPEHLLVVGGGYVGLEFAQMFRRFGSKVTVVQRSGKLLGREDEDVADEVKKVLEDDGLEILLNSRPTSVKRDNSGHNGLTLDLSISGEKRVITVSHVLAAAGRIPCTEDLGLESTGVAMDKGGFLKVNDRLETSVEGIYALGDVKGGPAFTHISYDDFRILKANLLDGGSASITDRLVPYTVFIDPQLGRIGLTEAEAKAQGRKIRVGKMPMASVARALEMDEAKGLMKVLVDGECDQIVGCAVLGIDGGEVMSMLQIAMMGKLPYTALRDGVFAHPLLAESLNNLFGSLKEV